MLAIKVDAGVVGAYRKDVASKALRASIELIPPINVWKRVSCEASVVLR